MTLSCLLHHGGSRRKGSLGELCVGSLSLAAPGREILDFICAVSVHEPCGSCRSLRTGAVAGAARCVLPPVPWKLQSARDPSGSGCHCCPPVSWGHSSCAGSLWRLGAQCPQQSRWCALLRNSKVENSTPFTLLSSPGTYSRYLGLAHFSSSFL